MQDQRPRRPAEQPRRSDDALGRNAGFIDQATTIRVIHGVQVTIHHVYRRAVHFSKIFGLFNDLFVQLALHITLCLEINRCKDNLALSAGTRTNQYHRAIGTF